MFPMLQERSILFQKLNNYNTQPGHSSNTINTPFINTFSHLLIESSYAAHFLFVQQHSCAILTKKKKIAAQDVVCVVLTVRTVPSSEIQKEILTSTATRLDMHACTFSPNACFAHGRYFTTSSPFLVNSHQPNLPHPCQKPCLRELLTSSIHLQCQIKVLLHC